MTDYDKWKKKKNRQDTITVLAVLAIVVLAGVACAWIQRNPEKTSIVVGESARNIEKEEARETSRKIIVAITIISLGVVVLFIRTMIKRRREEAEKIRKSEEEKRRLEEAKKRVEQAKLEALMNAGKKEINKRNIGDYDYRNELDDDFINDLNINKGRNFDKEDKVFLENLDFEENIIERIKRFIKKIFKRRDI